MTTIVIQNVTLNEMPLLCRLGSIERRNPRLKNAGLLYQFDPNVFLIPVNGTERTELIRQLVFSIFPISGPG